MGLLLAVGSLLIVRTTATAELQGVKCGDYLCDTSQYCSSHSKDCQPCSSVCNISSGKYDEEECMTDCRDYLRDKRYVLLKQYEKLRGEVGKLWILAGISTAIALLSLLSTLYLFASKFTRWQKMRDATARSFAGNGNGNSSSNNNNNNNNTNTKNNQEKQRRAQNDVESGTSKHNGLKLTMPTISASVAPSRHVENGSATSSGSRSGIENATPNTSSTTLSRRHPSEDTTLDYAYDNPAMTPSPESVQLRTKRESSF
ncbi:hypothetical protein WH47_10797 [Habropoda laboriosa]|uniref:Protein grindelwald n=1 Tax=Habropoda laboriosa TaxID=597456 RepID=A0A0L7RDB2_9HYME|nr:hypothetical protein WH47_10797 [Habropoda laboriosa]